ncbi:MAG: hypothetical protein MJ239_05865 [Bacilli bacterium]|nr:hypothetical protein [Bacilli bacterium]
MDKKKKITLITAGVAELAIIVFALVVSILVLVTFHDPEKFGQSQAMELNLKENGPFIGFLQNNPTAFFCSILIPVFAILAVDIIYLVIVAQKRATNLTDAETAAIKAKAKEEARLEVLKELEEEAKNEKKE